MSDTDHLYIDRPTIKLLLALLRRIPALAEDLAVTESKRARTTRPDRTGFRKRRKMNSSLPLNDDAYLKAEALRGELFAWVRLTCEQRSHDVPAVNSLIEASQWLARNVIALAMTEGAESAYPSIYAAVKGCERIIDLPPDDVVNVDLDQLEQANRSVVTAGQVEKIAGKLGDIGKGLNRDRIRYLDKQREISPVSIDAESGTRFYQLGEILQAHLRRKCRPRGA